MFEINRPGQEFFVILEGEVSFFVNFTPAEAYLSYELQQQCELRAVKYTPVPSAKPRQKSDYPGVPKPVKILSTAVHVASPPTQPEIFVLNEGTPMREVNKYTTGTEFGQVALLGQGLRQATAVATADTHLLVLDKNNFERILGRIKKKQDAYFHAMVREIYCFKGLHWKCHQSFLVNKTVEIFRYGEVVFDWNQQVNKMYLILEGCVTLLRKRCQKMQNKQSSLLEYVSDSLAAVGLPQTIPTKAKDESEQGEEAISTLRQTEVIELKRLVVNPPANHSDLEEISIRDAGQLIAEDFCTLGTLSNYRVVASSGKLVLASLTKEQIEHKLFQFTPSDYGLFVSMIQENLIKDSASTKIHPSAQPQLQATAHSEPKPKPKPASFSIQPHKPTPLLSPRIPSLQKIFGNISPHILKPNPLSSRKHATSIKKLHGAVIR